MSELARQLFGEDLPPKQLALIVDLDDTVCTAFACPISIALDVLRKLDRQRVAVHYVTARPEMSRAGTERFFEEHRLPGFRNLHLCPGYYGSLKHKKDKHVTIAREHRVIASIGDCDEDEGEAARHAGVPFVLVDRDNPVAAWMALRELIEAVGGFTRGERPA
ncbi:MAG: HAD family hydrolase [Planctomycetes bacterium]|nr:HAD family hydrolase [Planctomycetota bacterium]